MMDGLRLLTLSDLTFGEIKVLVATPREEDSWGVLAPLRETAWGPLIREVSGEAMSHARHGFSSPLMKEIGPHPKHLAGMISDKDGMCVLTRPGACAGAGSHCRPGRKLPDCYEPPTEAQDVATVVSLAWRDGQYVVVVIGDEFIAT